MTASRISARRLLALTGRGLGALASALAAVLWVYEISCPGEVPVLGGWSLGVAFLMVVFCLMGLIASLRGHGKMMLAVFLVCFLPIGAYLLYVDHVLWWIGILNLGLLVAAAMTLLASPGRGG
jgi:hypothetical protein